MTMQGHSQEIGGKDSVFENLVENFILFAYSPTWNRTTSLHLTVHGHSQEIGKKHIYSVFMN